MIFHLKKKETVGVNVPTIVFNNLEYAKETDLKVILHILNTQNCDAISISKDLNLNLLSVQSSILYWANLDLLHIQEETTKKTKKKPVLSAQDIMALSSSSSEIDTLVKEMQKIFSYTLNEKHTMKFIELLLEENIGVDAIISLSLYFKNLSDTSPSYIAKMISSANKKTPLTSFKQAEKYIHLLEERKLNLEKVAQIFSCSSEDFTTSEKTLIYSWFEKLNMSISMIKKSLEVAGSLADVKYCGGILKNWHRKKYTTVDDLKNEVMNFNQKEDIKILPKDDILTKAALVVPTLDEGV